MQRQLENVIDPQLIPGGPGIGDTSTSLEAAQARAAQCADAAQAAINRALSGNSEAWLNATRQTSAE